MKTLLTLLFCFFTIPIFGQRPSIDSILKAPFIDFNKPYQIYRIKGELEIHGHYFLNDTSKCPIIYFSTKTEVVIVNPCSDIMYTIYPCSHAGCKVLHLRSGYDTYSSKNGWEIKENWIRSSQEFENNKN